MDKCIIFKNDNGYISVIFPSPDCELSLEEIAKKDVPTGKRYKFILSSEIPNREDRENWVVDDSLFTDGVGV
jgi:hypothetical protein